MSGVRASAKGRTRVAAPTRRSTEGPVVGTADIADVIRVVELLGDRAAIVDLNAGVVLWYSTGFQREFPENVVGESLQLLCAAFTGLETCLTRYRTAADASSRTDSLIRTSVRHRQGECFGIVLRHLDDGRLLFRIDDKADPQHVIQRHLEDREKLLFTSRVISVSEMATALAHELNQPVGTIANLVSGAAMRLKRPKPNTEEIIAALDRATDQAMFVSKIIARIREFTHSFQPKPTRLDGRELVATSVALLDWEIRRHNNLTVDLDLGHQPLFILGDEVMLQQVIVNLLRNAIDAMRDCSGAEHRLAVRCQVDGGQVEIAIRDSGTGLSAEAEQNLFVPFVSTKPSGMGVGLNICRSFVELHQGRLWMTRNDGAGCTFHVALPREVATVAVA